MKKMIYWGVALIVLLGINFFHHVINENKNSTTTGKIFDLIEINYGIESIRLEDTTTNSVVVITGEDSIDQFKKQISGIVLTSSIGNGDIKEDYSLDIAVKRNQQKSNQTISGFINSKELLIGDDYYTGDGIEEVQDTIQQYISNY
ncbi:hypothetical protein [Alkalicoccobacillus murimartini]|uniref:Uncharacterized protein n=1 Tax=Alkalicoccobacillus murimartini TaxID=171685 RepID=A0ABT9YL39_9BACI|nr:hypothetical protein [Alkalicoccobacillus murimartini]MDQ0208593.1 hypothetical protein [Alkalicoccobacillus murimartini]